MKAFVLGAAALAATASTLHANDSIATTAAGGLVLARTDAIDMVSEDLFVSVDQIRVGYVFRNRTAHDVKATVAFPMPDRPLLAEDEGDVALPSDFRTLVGGRPVAMKVERRMVHAGRDVTATLAALHIPAGGDIDAALDRLPAADQARLVRLGLAQVREEDDGHGMKRHLLADWTIKETWYWEQTFPAGRDLQVEHRYKPGAGGSVSTILYPAELRRTGEARRYMADYCVDRDFLASLDRAAARHGPRKQLVFPDRRIDYVLTTGANWRAPIGSFRLVVDKGAPTNLVSFCGEGVRRLSPTRFEMRKVNWRPDRDLKVVIVTPTEVDS
jgi:hypothetical protein